MDAFLKAEELRAKWIEKYNDNSKLFENLRLKQRIRLTEQMLDLYEAAAKQNHAEAAYRLALYYSNYRDWSRNHFDHFYSFSEDNKKAAPWLTLAASLGHEKAIVDAAEYFYKIGQSGKAIEWLEKDVCQDKWEMLVNCYKLSNNAEKELALLKQHRKDGWTYEFRYAELEVGFGHLEAMEALASQDNRHAVYRLAQYYQKQQDYPKGIQWYTCLYGYESYAEVANRQLETYLQVGKIDKKELWDIYKKAVQKHLNVDLEKMAAIECDLITLKKADAYYVGRMAIAYLKGDLVEKDVKKGFVLINKAYAFNNCDEFTSYLGDCHYFGWGTAVNFTKARGYFENLTKLYSPKSPYANLLGAQKTYTFFGPMDHSFKKDVQITYCYCREKNYKQAIICLPLIIESYGDKQPWAMYELGRCYYDGLGTAKDYKKAFEYYSRAAKAKYVYSYNELGRCYLAGYGVAKDCGKAFEWFNKFMENEKGHNHIIYFNMGLCYADGHLFEKNLHKALDYFQKSANLGYEPAKTKIAEVKQQLSVTSTPKVTTNTTVSSVQKTNVMHSQENNVSATAKDELEALVGLTNVKKEILALENMMKMNKLRREMGLAVNEISKHMVFTGNPGTGKTTVARIVARIFKENGFLSKGQLIETDRGGMIEGFIGHTAKKTKKRFQEAMGGVLFIDEAYALIPEDSTRDYGPEAVATLIKLMEDNKEDIVVIVAGYKKEMKHFIDSNPGLKSRFTTYIDFEDYQPEEMQQIFELMLQKYQYHLDEDARDELMKLWRASKYDENFGNGRGVRNVFEKVISNQANRLMTSEQIDRNLLTLITREDIPGLEEVFH